MSMFPFDVNTNMSVRNHAMKLMNTQSALHHAEENLHVVILVAVHALSVKTDIFTNHVFSADFPTKHATETHLDRDKCPVSPLAETDVLIINATNFALSLVRTIEALIGFAERIVNGSVSILAAPNCALNNVIDCPVIGHAKNTHQKAADHDIYVKKYVKATAVKYVVMKVF